MKKTVILSLLALLLSFSGARAQQQLVDRLVANINEMSLQEKVDTKELAEEFIDISDNGRYNDVMILQLYLEVNIPDADVEKFIRTQQADGSWPDIDYKDNKRSRWAPANHATRIQSLAKVYKTPGSKFYNSKELSAVLHKALNFWFDAELVCPNWWYNEIGVPRLLGPAFLLLRDELSAAELDSAEKVLDKAGFRMTGQNKVWLAGSVFIKGLLRNDMALAQQARDTIVSEIFMSTAEGLQPDYSFHQHGPQMQFGNYGLAYLGTISYWARVFSGTPLALTPAQIELIRNYALEGLQWTVWRGYMDVNASARQVFLKSQKGKAHSVAVSAVNMIPMDPDRAKDYKSYIYRNQVNPGADNDLTGNKYYWRSDYAVQRTPRWFASARMHSDRTLGFEMTNRENLQGIYSADGVLMVMVDGNEYEDIYPVWDWKRLPGLTAFDDGKPIAFFHPNKPVNRSGFVGGVSDGRKGAAAMILDREGIGARKAYFFSDQLVVCLGSGISTDNDFPVSTTLDQRYLPSEVVYGAGGREVKVGPGRQVTVPDADWIYAGKTGYVLLDPARVQISTDVQSGSWKSIADFYTADQVASASVFKAWIEQGKALKDASYAYCVLPDASLSAVERFAQSPDVEVVNTADYQGVFFKNKGLWQIVFYTPSTVTLGGMEMTASDAGIVMVEQTAEGALVSVADPTQKLSSFSFEITSMPGRCMTAEPVYVELPTREGMRGSTVTTEM